MPAAHESGAAHLSSSWAHRLLAPFEPPPERAQSVGADFALGFGAAWVYCAVVGTVSYFFAERVFRNVFAGLTPGKKAMWHCYSYCLLSGVIACWLMAPDLYPLFVEHVQDARYQYYARQTPSFRRAAGFSCGFLTFDLTVLLVAHRILIEAYKRPLYLQLLVHHTLSIASWPLTIQHSLAMGFVAYCILTESTSIFVNLHWLLREAKVDGTSIGMLNSALLFVSYFLVRIVPIPWVVWCWLTCAKEDWTWVEWIYGAILIPLPSLFNIFWFSLIMRGAKAKLAVGARAKNGTDQKKAQLLAGQLCEE